MLVTFADMRVVWMARPPTRSAAAPSSWVDMGVLIAILLVTIGLSVRAGLYGRRWNVADSEDSSLIATCARSFVLVLLSLLGLLALGVMYGNVLGVAHVAR